MYISTFEVSNYKSYRHVPAVGLTAGFNIITGKNNSGKTALLEALSLRCTAKPHRSISTVPTEGSVPDPWTTIGIACPLTRQELSSIFLIRDTNFAIRLPQGGTPFAVQRGYTGNTYGSELNVVKWLFSQDVLMYKLMLRGQFGTGQLSAWPSSPPCCGLYPSVDAELSTFAVDSSNDISWQNRIGTGYESFVGKVAEYIQSAVYTFKAERFNAGICSFGQNSILQPNAANLAEVLNLLQSDLGRREEYNRLLNTIFPDVYAVAVRPLPSNNLEVMVWTTPPNLKRPDLAIPLNECGTGLGQVLAILYVVLTSRQQQTIIIDEPQSFLHPGAARKLIDVLSQFPDHQYVIATHSPTVISACSPRTIKIIRNVDGVSTIEEVSAAASGRLSVCLAEVGAKLGDVFGADKVLWVEGATEEICFPKILTGLTQHRLMGTVIQGVRSTGDFDGKQAEAIIDAYSRLAGAASLLPPAVGFLFDVELRTEQQMEDLRKRAAIATDGKAKMWFLKRRMFENYLLHPGAMAAVLNADDLGKSAEYSEPAIASILAAKLGDKGYIKGVSKDLVDADPEGWCDAPLLLKELFSQASEARVHFDKTDHSVRLAEWLLEHEPEKLIAVAELLIQVLNCS
jgi:predicted ATPase